MAKIYTPNTWTDETLTSNERYEILEDDGTPISTEVQINLTSTVAVAGSPVNAERMNNIETGVDTLDTQLSSIRSEATELTIASGVITVTQSNHKLQPQSGTADELITINGAVAGQSGVFYASDFGTDTITIKHDAGNIFCENGADVNLSSGCVFWHSDGGTVFISGVGSPPIRLSDRSPIIYTADDTWVKPDGLHHIIVEVQAGGGGGGGVIGTASQAAVGGSGGGGAYARAKFMAVDCGADGDVVIGQGGTGGAAGNNAGGNGNASQFNASGTNYLSANPGLGGDGHPSSTTVPRVGATPGDGGTSGASVGESGDALFIDGAPGIVGLIVNISTTITGKGGGSHLGAMVSSVASATANEAGVAGTQYGGGGSGARSSNNGVDYAGGAGADGVIVVWEYVDVAGGGGEGGAAPVVTQYAIVGTQFDKTSDTTLANITDLTVDVVTGNTYSIQAAIFTNSTNAGGVKFSIAGTCTATALIVQDVVHGVGSAFQTTLGSTMFEDINLPVYLSRILGTITVNASGTLTVQFAQSVSNATPSSVLVGSSFEVTRV